jgi:hypothetical protein
MKKDLNNKIHKIKIYFFSKKIQITIFIAYSW